MENKSGWTLQNLHCNTAAALQSRHRKHFPCFYYQVTETQISEDVWENVKCLRNLQYKPYVIQCRQAFSAVSILPKCTCECFYNSV